jgi:hypothetical protein
LRFQAYVDWLQYTEQQYEFLRKHIAEPGDEGITHEYFRQQSAALSPLRLLASDEVLAKVEEYVNAYDDAFTRLIEPTDPAESELFSEAILELEDAAEPLLDRVILTMRADLQRPVFGRRRSL